MAEHKVSKCRQLLQEFGGRKKATLKELQSLLVFFNFACSVIVPGRPFLRHVIDLTVGVPKPQLRIRLTKEAKQDLAVWAEFLNNYNDKSFFISDRFFILMRRWFHGCGQTPGYHIILLYFKSSLLWLQYMFRVMNGLIKADSSKIKRQQFSGDG